MKVRHGTWACPLVLLPSCLGQPLSSAFARECVPAKCYGARSYHDQLMDVQCSEPMAEVCNPVQIFCDCEKGIVVSGAEEEMAQSVKVLTAQAWSSDPR